MQPECATARFKRPARYVLRVRSNSHVVGLKRGLRAGSCKTHVKRHEWDKRAVCNAFGTPKNKG